MAAARRPLRVGIMGAMPQEIISLVRELKSATEETIAERTYHHGLLHEVDVVAVFSRWGKVAAAATAVTLILKYAVDLIIFTGVAGSLDKMLRIGDVVIAAHLFQHDMDASPFFEPHHIPLTNQKLFGSPDALTEVAHAAVSEYLAHTSEMFSPETLVEFGMTTPKAYVGTVASGDQFVKDARVRERIKEAADHVLAVEMEGAAVAQICGEHGRSHLVIRTISDGADIDSPEKFTRFISSVASDYSAGIVKALFNNPTFFDAMTRIQVERESLSPEGEHS